MYLNILINALFWSVAWCCHGRPETRDYLKNRGLFLRVPFAQHLSRLGQMSWIFMLDSGLVWASILFSLCPPPPPLKVPLLGTQSREPSVPVLEDRHSGTPVVTLRCHVQDTGSERYHSSARAEQTTSPANVTSSWAWSILVPSTCIVCLIGSF